MGGVGVKGGRGGGTQACQAHPRAAFAAAAPTRRHGNAAPTVVVVVFGGGVPPFHVSPLCHVSSSLSPPFTWGTGSSGGGM